MITYITAFIFYTLAMIGILLVGFIVYKKTIQNTKTDNKGMIKILDSTLIAPKKHLLVVRVKNEKFLIASGLEHTTFLAKLSDDKEQTKTVKNEYDEENSRRGEIRYDDIQKAKLDKIQRQFRELYAQNEPHKPIEQTVERKEMIKQLLRDLNETTTRAGGKF